MMGSTAGWGAYTGTGSGVMVNGASVACAACGSTKAQSEFSPNQLRKAAARRCKQCVSRGSQPAGAQPAAGFTRNTQAPAGTQPTVSAFAWNAQQKQAPPAGTKPATSGFRWNTQQNQQAPSAGTKPAASGFTWNTQQNQQAPSAGTKPAASGFTWNTQQSQQATVGTKPVAAFTWQDHQAPSATKAASGFTWNTQQALSAGTKAAAAGFTWNMQNQQAHHPVAPTVTSTATKTGFSWQQPATQSNTAGSATATFSLLSKQTGNAQQITGQVNSPFKFTPSQPQHQSTKSTWTFAAGSSPPTQAPTSPLELGNTSSTTVSSLNDSTPQPVHSGVSCDICSAATIVGPRYKCLCCPNFDACEACVAKGSLGRSQSKSGTSAGTSCGCKHDVLVRVCEPQWMSIGAEALQNQSAWAHPGFSCSGCGVKTIVGRRYTCTVCDNAHFCERCDFCGVHAAAGLEPHPMLRVNPTAPVQATSTPVIPPASPADAAAREGRAGVIASPNCFCCGWPQHEADARGHKKKKSQ